MTQEVLDGTARDKVTGIAEGTETHTLWHVSKTSPS